MTAITYGQTVAYKGKPYLVTSVSNKKAKLLNPKYSPCKLHVLVSNLEVVNHPPARLVEHRGSEYLVTQKKLIVSLNTNRAMKWKNDHGMRKAILAKTKTSGTVALY